MTPKLFQINGKEEVTLESNGTLYIIEEYTDEYCERLSAWKVNCVSEYNKYEHEQNGSELIVESFYESEFKEFAQKYNFNPPPRKPSLKTIQLNERISNLLDAPKKLNDLLSKRYNWQRGVYKEELIKHLLMDLLREYLARHENIKIESGFVSNKPKEHSRQMDVIIYQDIDDKVFKCENFVIVPSELVISVIEIKTKINSSQLLGNKKNSGALANQFDISRFEKSNDRHIIKCILAFEKGFSKIDSFQKWIQRFYKDKTIDSTDVFKSLPTIIGTLDGFCVVFGKYINKPAMFPSDSNEGISGFQTFYITLLNQLVDLLQLEIPNIREYLNLLPHEGYRNDNPMGIDWEKRIIINS